MWGLISFTYISDSLQTYSYWFLTDIDHFKKGIHVFLGMRTSKIPWRFAFLKITVWLSKGEYLQSFALERQTGTRSNFTTTKETESGGLSDVYAATSGSRMLKAETAPSRHHLEAPQKGDNRLLGKRAP